MLQYASTVEICLCYVKPWNEIFFFLEVAPDQNLPGEDQDHLEEDRDPLDVDQDHPDIDQDHHEIILRMGGLDHHINLIDKVLLADWEEDGAW